jgi:hypothetical protein
MGQITTQNVGSVAAETLEAALRGRAVYIPGALNRVLAVLGGLVPPAWVAHFIGRRWKAARGGPSAPAGMPAPALARQTA